MDELKEGRERETDRKATAMEFSYVLACVLLAGTLNVAFDYYLLSCMCMRARGALVVVFFD